MPGALDQACASALSKVRSLRTASVTELLSEVEAYLDDRREAARLRQIVARALEHSQDSLHQQNYGQAVSTLLEGLSSVPQDPSLLEQAAQVYWRVFTEVYPGGATADRAQEASAWLARLAAVSLANVVAAAPQDLGSEDAHEDPWLHAVRRLAAGERPEASGPKGLVALVRRLDRLASVSLFEAMASPELLPIAEACHEATFAAQEVLFEAGDLGDTLYVVDSGQLEVVQGQTVLTKLEPGDAFGEVAVFGAHRRTATVREAKLRRQSQR